MLDLFRNLFPRPDQSLWHKCFFPVFGARDINGRWLSLTGQTWRKRRPDGRWEYKQDEATEQDYLDNAW